MVEAIGFDFDDTLIMSEKEKVKIIAELFKEFFNVTRGVKSTYKGLLGKANREEKLAILIQKFTEKKATKKQITQMSLAFSKHYQRHLASCPMIRCVDKLKELRKRVNFMFLLSLEKKEDVKILAQHCGIAKYFDEILGGPKGKAQNFRHIIRVHRIKPKEALYIGDSSGDMANAAKFGFFTMGLARSSYKKSVLKKAGAKKVITDLCDFSLENDLLLR